MVRLLSRALRRAGGPAGERGQAPIAIVVMTSLLLMAVGVSFMLRLATAEDQARGLQTAADAAALAGAGQVSHRRRHRLGDVAADEQDRVGFLDPGDAGAEGHQEHDQRLQREQAGLNLRGLSMTPAQMQDRFDALLTRYGYSRDNLGDVAATYLVMAWEVVNDRNAKDVAGGERAVREQLRRALLARPALREMDDAAKQALAERLMYSAMRNGVSYQVYRQTDQRAQLAALSERMRGEVMRAGLGLDLRRFELSANGLVRR